MAGHGEQPGLQYLLDQLDARIHATHMTIARQESYQDLGHDAMTLWHQSYAHDLHPHLKNELGIYDVVLDDVRLSGKLDKVVIDPSDPSRVMVVDYKTGRHKTVNEILGKTQNSTGDIYRQLVFYKLLLKYHAGGRYTMTDGVIDFVIPDKKTGKLRRETFQPTDGEVLELEQQIKDVAQQIRTLSFWDEPIDESLPELEEYLPYIHAVKN